MNKYYMWYSMVDFLFIEQKQLVSKHSFLINGKNNQRWTNHTNKWRCL